MPPLTFPCPLCSRRMGVGMEMLGRPVRCPHCRQVVIAPKSPDAAARTPDARLPQSNAQMPTSNPPPYRAPEFDTERHEGAESIFSPPGTDDDSVFESPQAVNRVELPANQPPLPATVPVVRTPEMVGAKAPPVPIPVTTPWPAMPAVGESGLSPNPADVSSPWTKLDDFAPGQPKPVVVLPPMASAVGLSSMDKALATVAPPDEAKRDRRRKILFIALAAYATIMTAVAIWGILRGGDRGHPLNNIPDLFGEFARSSRDQARKLPVDDKQPLPAELKVKIGGTVMAGALKIEPLGISERPVTQVNVYADDRQSPTTRQLGTCLVLRLRLTNTSANESFHPLDTAYNRKVRTGQDAPLTGILLPSGVKHTGGPVQWPFGSGLKRVCLEGQEADATPLGPKETRDSFVASVDEPERLANIRKSRSAVWLVHLRRGSTFYRWQDVPVGTLIGVEFDPQQIEAGR